MADCFVSYRRTPSSAVATALQAKLEAQYRIDAYVDTTRTDSTRVRFPERLMQAIADAPVFVCLLGERDGQHTLESEWVLKEIQQAYDLRKFCIPVFQESYRPLPDMPAAVDYLLGFDGVHILDQKNIMINESVRQVADLIQPYKQKSRLPWVAGIGAVVVLILMIIAVFSMLNGSGDAAPASTPDLEPTTAVAAMGPANTLTEPTISGFEQLQTTEAQLTLAAQTQLAADLTATEDGIRNANATSTAAQIAATETSAFATLLALSATPTPFIPSQTPAPTLTNLPTNTLLPPTNTLFIPPPTITPRPTDTPDPLQSAFTPVLRNADWTPVEQDFDGVTMMLVPAGCFDMGSDDSGVDERPVHEICFDEPFWIDKYEVTNADYGSIGCDQWSSEPDQPRNCVSWFNARVHCESRGSRLPTEAEWEYAARGPDSLVYPWGNDFVANNGVHSSNSGNQTAPGGSRPGGASWVGAMDLSGNLWEWTSSIYEAYPYDETDGRERDTGDRTNVLRVLRGGSFVGTSLDLRSADRGWGFPVNVVGLSFGFRCARSY